MTTSDRDREAFEKMYRSVWEKPSLLRDDNGYIYAHAHTIHRFWQAALEYARQSPPQPYRPQPGDDVWVRAFAVCSLLQMLSQSATGIAHASTS